MSSRSRSQKGTSSHHSWGLDCKVYVGDLGSGTARQELRNIFGRYGEIRNLWVARNPPGFAFIEFQHRQDALDAVDALQGW